jgi:ABC-type lipoprotein export system ATPase subunit
MKVRQAAMLRGRRRRGGCGCRTERLGEVDLLHCAAGILRPDGGEVVFEGRRIDSLGEAERSRLRRTSFGFVFQFGQLVPS